MALRTVPIETVSHRKRTNMPDEITVICPSCKQPLICQPSSNERANGVAPCINEHDCSEAKEKVWFLNVGVPGKETALFGVGAYNATEPETTKRK